MKKQARGGLTLIEVGVAATISSLLAALGIGLIYSMLTVQSNTKAQADRQRTVDRLAETFRTDAHRAEVATLEDAASGEKQVVFTQTPDRSVRYTLTDGEVLREVNTGEKRIAVDSFLLSKDTCFEVSLDTAEEKTLAMLTIRQEPIATSRKRLPPIVAAVGVAPASVTLSLPPEPKEKPSSEAESASTEAAPTEVIPAETTPATEPTPAEEGANE